MVECTITVISIYHSFLKAKKTLNSKCHDILFPGQKIEQMTHMGTLGRDKYTHTAIGYLLSNNNNNMWTYIAHVSTN